MYLKQEREVATDAFLKGQWWVGWNPRISGHQGHPGEQDTGVIGSGRSTMNTGQEGGSLDPLTKPSGWKGRNGNTETKAMQRVLKFVENVLSLSCINWVCEKRVMPSISILNQTQVYLMVIYKRKLLLHRNLILLAKTSTPFNCKIEEGRNCLPMMYPQRCFI